MSDLGSPKEPLSKNISKSGFSLMLQKCDLMKFNGKAHSISYYMEETYKGKLSYTQDRMTHRDQRQKGKEDPVIES